jgi:hypothetical protein
VFCSGRGLKLRTFWTQRCGFASCFWCLQIKTEWVFPSHKRQKSETTLLQICFVGGFKMKTFYLYSTSVETKVHKDLLLIRIDFWICKFHWELFSLGQRYVLGVTTDGLWVGYWIHWHNSELHVITAPSLITLYKSPPYPLSLLPGSCVSISRSMATASNSGDSSASRAQVLSSQTPLQNATLNCLTLTLAVISHQSPSLLFTVCQLATN